MAVYAASRPGRLREVTPAPSAGQLVRSARTGDQEAWAALVDRFTGLLWHVARSIDLGHEDRADLVQLCWLRLNENLGRLRDPDAVVGWLATTARREGLRLSRARSREQPRLAEDLDRRSDAPSPDDLAATHDLHARLRAALARLPERDQRLLRVLSASPPPAYADVSAALGMPIGSIGPTRARALARLRRELEAEGIDAQCA